MRIKNPLWTSHPRRNVWVQGCLWHIQSVGFLAGMVYNNLKMLLPESYYNKVLRLFGNDHVPKLNSFPMHLHLPEVMYMNWAYLENVFSLPSVFAP